ncbi:C2H2-type zinc finger protein [Haloplanus rubicundus]
MRIHHKLAHDESLAEREDRYRCPECGREVETKRGLSNHLSKVHPKTWEQLQSEGMVLIVHHGE